MKLKDAMIAWLALNILLVPALASVQSPVDNAQVSITPHAAGGYFSRVEPTAENKNIPFAEGSTAAYKFSSALPVLIYIMLSLAFAALALRAGSGQLWKASVALGMFAAVPFFTSSALAAGINSVTIQGDDGIPDFVRPYGTMYLTVNVSFPGDDNLTKDQLAVRFGREYMLFTQCKLSNQTLGCEKGKDNNTFVCECINMLGSERNPLTNRKNSMKILLYSDRNKITPADATLKTFYVDNQPPTISRFNIAQVKDRVQADFSVDEHGLQCSGLSKIEFYSNGMLLAADTINVEAEPNNCTALNKKTNLSISQSGNTTIKIVAYDNLGNAASQNKTLYLDFDEPVIGTTFKVLQGGNEVNYISTQGPAAGLAGATIQFEINEHELDYIIADLSTLNDNIAYSARYKDLNISQGNLQTMCLKEGETYTCRLNGSTLLRNSTDFFIRTQSPQLTINVTAADKNGLKSSQTLTANLLLDNDRPVVKKLGTLHCNPEHCYFNKDSAAIHAIIDDAGSGLDYSWVFADTTAIDGKKESQMYCSDNNGEWSCLYSTKPTGSHQDEHAYRIMLNYKSVDDAGNPVDGQRQALIYYDSKAPVVDWENSGTLSYGDDGIMRGYHLSGDTLYIGITINESGSGIIDENGQWDVKVNLDGIIDSANASWTNADSCTKTGNDTWVCTWSAGPLVEGPLQKQLKFRIYDVAGNLNDSYTIDDFRIYGIAKNTPQNAVSHTSIKCMPEFLDRSVVAYFPGGNTVWCSFNLTSSAYKIVDVKQSSECIPRSNESRDYFQKSMLVGASRIPSGGNSTVPLLLKMTFDQERIAGNVSRVSYVCPLAVVLVKNNLAYGPTPGDVEVEIPIGESGADLEESLASGLEEMKRRIKGDKWLGKTEEILGKLRLVCNLMNLLTSFIVSAEEAFSSAEAAIPAWLKPFIGSALNAAEKGNDGVWTAIGGFCQFLQCKIGLGGFLEKMGGEGAVADLLKAVEKYPRMAINWQNNIPNAIKQKSVGNPSQNPLDANELVKRDMLSADSYDNIILSILTLCIPGILYNMQKARNINCYYVFCMEKMVPMGRTVYSCQQSRALMYCQFVVGQLFSWIPIASLIGSLGDVFSRIAAGDVPTIAGVVIATIPCSGLFTFGSITLGKVCQHSKHFFQMISTGKDIWSNLKSFSTGDVNWCKEAGLE